MARLEKSNSSSSANPNPRQRLSPSGFEITDEEFNLFRDLIRKEAGISLADHKRELVVSRLSRRLRALGLKTFNEYYVFLTEDPSGLDEMSQMINRMTTNKTEFYREAHHFSFLAEELLPRLTAEKERLGQRRIRAWSAACSTGEEPYTIAITLTEFFTKLSGWDIKILATDLDTEVLTFASQGVYPQDRINPVPRHLLSKHFAKVSDSEPLKFKVSPSLRQMITFRRFNLLHPHFPFKTPLDFIFCRNVMIYFGMEDKTALLKKFHKTLKTDGHIFVGHSESLMMVKDLFRYIKSTIYKKI